MTTEPAVGLQWQHALDDCADLDRALASRPRQLVHDGRLRPHPPGDRDHRHPDPGHPGAATALSRAGGRGAASILKSVSPKSTSWNGFAMAASGASSPLSSVPLAAVMSSTGVRFSSECSCRTKAVPPMTGMLASYTIASVS